MFLVTTIWRGSLHISPMRTAETEDEAWRKAAEHREEVRVYEVFPDREPRLCKKPKDQL
jgi:hypothetical protein